MSGSSLRAYAGILLVAGLAVPSESSPGASPGTSSSAVAAQSRRKAKRAPPLVPFEGTLVEATGLARDRNVPLVQVWIVESEPWDPKEHYDIDDLRLAVVDDAELAVVLERAVVVLACNRVHELEEIEVGEGDARERRRRCVSYHTIDCTRHQRLFDEIYAEHNVDGQLRSPFVLVRTPDGEETARHGDGHAPKKDQLLSEVRRAQKSAGHGLTSGEHAQVLQLCARAREQAGALEHGPTWITWGEVLAITETTPYAEEARAGQKTGLEAMQALRESGHAEVAAGRVIEGYEILAQLTASAVGTPLERDLARELKKLERNREHKEAIEAYKRGVAAEAILNEVDALLRAGDERKARTKLKLLFKRYANTPAAATARERWPHLVPS